jgi:hypothetical protein
MGHRVRRSREDNGIEIEKIRRLEDEREFKRRTENDE